MTLVNGRTVTINNLPVVTVGARMRPRKGFISMDMNYIFPIVTILILILFAITIAYSEPYQYPITKADTIIEVDCYTRHIDPVKIPSVDIIP